MTKKISKHYLYFCLILFGIFLFRLPSLFEPYWYGDEGIFAAVARNLNLGGVLYQTAWDNKPPLIYLTYFLIFKFFGVSMFNIHLAATIAVMTTATAIYVIVKNNFSERRALVAMSLFGILSILRVFEGNLALTEVFVITSNTLAMLLVIIRKFDLRSLFFAGILFAVGSLYKQVGAFEAAVIGLYLIFISQNFFDFFKKGAILSIGFAIPYIITFAYFFRLGLVEDFVFAAYTYYKIYFEESPQYAIFINILKYSPILLALGFAFYKRKIKSISIFNLYLLWLGFSFLGSYFSGRAYGHYMVQSLPALSVAMATIPYRRKFKKTALSFGLAIAVTLFVLTKLLFSPIFTWHPEAQFNYYRNFLNLVSGKISVDEYNNFFDTNVNSIMSLSDFLKANHVEGKTVYVWGDISWLYAISDVWNPSRYVTSFHVFGVPNGKEEVMVSLAKNKPEYIIKRESSIGYFEALEKLLASDYTLVSNVGDSNIYLLKGK